MSSGRSGALMEQFAALKQKAMEARDLNVEFMTSFERSQNGSPPTDPYADPVWDVSAAEAERQFPSRVENVTGEATEEERAYIKAVSSKKRGDDALVDHLNKKVRVAEKRSSAQNLAHPDVIEMEGIPVSEANARFNRRF